MKKEIKNVIVLSFEMQILDLFTKQESSCGLHRYGMEDRSPLPDEVMLLETRAVVDGIYEAAGCPRMHTLLQALGLGILLIAHRIPCRIKGIVSRD